MAGGIKRKATALEAENEDLADEARDQPRKLPAIANPIRPGLNQPLRPSRTATNLPKVNTRNLRPAPLTKPTAPNITARTRATSAPPKAIGTSRSVSGSAMYVKKAPPVRAPLGRSVSGGPSRPSDQRFNSLQKQVASIESARVADSARLAKEMEAERAAVSGLKADHEALSRELNAVRNQEITQRRELAHASDELEAIKRRHTKEIEEMEITTRKKERELRDTKEDLRVTQEDLERERETVKTLKATISQQSTAHISLTTQVNALQVQLTALQNSLSVSSENASCLRFDLEVAQKRIEELETEVREAEMVRRKLHNMVQELKGNIRVFCRVRPLLPSDIPTDMTTSSSTSSLVLVSKSNSPVPEDLENLRGELLANITYPDKFDHKEIVLSTSTENAMGQERKENWGFSFDRVGLFERQCSSTRFSQTLRSLSQTLPRRTSLKRSLNLHRAARTGITSVSLRTVKLAVGRFVDSICYSELVVYFIKQSFTMEGGSSPDTSGMIPRAVEQVFKVIEDLKSKGWEYILEGQFLEIVWKLYSLFSFFNPCLF